MSNDSISPPDVYWRDFSPKHRGWRIFIALAAVVFGIVAVKFDGPLQAAAKPSAGLEQCSNLTTTCDAAHASNWQTGNLGSNNSVYPEGSSVPFRSVVTGLAVGQTYMATIEWDSTENGGHHAYDYITSFNRTEVNAAPCAGVSCAGSTSQLAIPNDSHVTGAGVTPIASQNITIFGGTFPASGASVTNTGNLCGTATCVIAANPSAYSFAGTFSAASQTGIMVYFTAAHTTAVLAWGGHVASAGDWGTGNSASALSGSPYHMRVMNFLCSDDSSCSSGNMDRSMSANAVVAPTTTTLAPTTTTTTLAPTTTTTLAPTTTTLAPTTTTTVVEATTTTVVGTTTTVAPSTTIVAAGVTTTTTIPPELQVINPTGTGGVDGSADTLFPDELPATGWRFGYNGLLAVLIIIVGASLVALAGPRRGRKSGGK
jgi:hypothetical protein